MAADLDQVNTKTAKQVQSEALGKGLWRALWIAIAICLVWLVVEGGFRLYHRPAQLDARVVELEAQLAKVLTQEAEINLALKSSLENQKNLAPVANQLNHQLHLFTFNSPDQHFHGNTSSADTIALPLLALKMRGA